MKTRYAFFNLLVLLLLVLLASSMFGSNMISASVGTVPSADTVIYDDELSENWNDWSWDTTVDLSEQVTVYNGAQSISVEYNEGWVGFYLRNEGSIDLSEYGSLRFWIHGGQSSGQKVRVHTVDGDENTGPDIELSPLSSGWQQVDVSVADLGSTDLISGFIWQNNTDSAQPVFYIDDVSLISEAATSTATSTPSDTLIPSPTGVVYDDTLLGEWTDASWQSEVDYEATEFVRGGTAAIAIEHLNAHAGLYLYNDSSVDVSSYNTLRFWIHGGTNA